MPIRTRYARLTVTALVLSSLAAATASADPPRRRGPPSHADEPACHHAPRSIEEHLARMKEHLSLTDEQVSLVRPLLERFGAAGGPHDPEAHAELREALEDVLTPEQLDLLARAHGPGHPPRNPAARLARVLGLDERQVAAVRAIFDELRPAPGPDADLAPEARREARRTRRAEIHRRIEAVLRPDQVARFREEVRRRRGGHEGPCDGPPDAGGRGEPR